MDETVAVVRVAIATILLIAFSGKVIGGPSTFANALARYRIFPQRLLFGVAWGAIVAEPVVAVALLVSHSPIPLFVACLMFFAFAAVTTIAHHRDSSLECGCLGAVVRLNMTSTASIANAIVASSALVSAFAIVIAPATDGAVSIITIASGVSLAGLYWLFIFSASVTESVQRARS